MTEIPVPVLGNPTGIMESPDGKLRESPVTSAKDARPVQSPLTSSSSMDSPKNKHKDIKKENKVGSDSPSWGGEGRRPTNTHRFDNTPDQASVVPKFGDWDENDPSSGDQYTGIFEKAREEKNSSATKPPMITIEPDFYPSNISQKSKGFSCFGWLWK